MCLLTHGTHLEPICFYWNKIDYLVIGDYFSKYLIVRRLPNSSTHAVIKELGLIFHRTWQTIRATLRQWTVLQFEGISQLFLNLHQVDHVTSSPHLSTKQWFRRGFGGYCQEADGTNLQKRGKPWNFGLLQYRTTPISSTLPVSIRDVDRKGNHV